MMISSGPAPTIPPPLKIGLMVPKLTYALDFAQTAL